MHSYYDFSLSIIVQGYFNPNALLVHWNNNGQGLLYLTNEDNTYYVAIDSDNNIKPILQSEVTKVS